MGFATCLVSLRQEGKITREQADRFGREYDRLNEAYSARMSKVAAADLASRDTLTGLEYTAIQDRRTAMMQIGAQRDLLARLADHVAGGGKITHAAMSAYAHHEAVFGVESVEDLRGAFQQLAWTRMQGFLGRYKRDILGRVRNGNELADVVRELRGESTGNADALEMARAVADTMEFLRQQFNAAGGAIPKMADWGLPQSHDSLEIAKATYPVWRDFIKDLLDPAKMIDNTTGRAFASEEALDQALEQTWRNISSHGLDGQVPGAFTGTGKIANRHIDHRFLVFKNADAWMQYNERFGMGDAFDAIIGHIDSMSRDIAAMQILGPNPGATTRWLADLLRQDALPTIEGGQSIPLQKGAKRTATTISNMWDYYSGALSAVPPEYRGTARFFSGIRNWMVMSKLGSAFLSAVPSDPVFMGMTAKFNGLPVTSVMGSWIKGFNPLDGEHRLAAEHAGLIFTDMTQRAERMWSEGRGINIHEMTRRGADALLRTSLLTPHTVAAKQSIGMGFMKDWGEHVGQAFDALDEPKRLALERYGITSQDWDALRRVGPVSQAGYKLLRPGDLARLDTPDAIASAVKFMSLIDGETRFGVPGESLRAQAATATLANSLQIQRGTKGGELVHSALQFKTYSAIVMMTHLERALYGRGGVGRLTYALALPTLLTLSGVIADAMIDVASGKDPSPLADASTWYRGATRGGGLGIAGDLISQGFSGDNRATGGVAGFVLGPTMGSVVEPLVNLTLGNIGEVAQEKPTHIGSEITQQVRNLTPGSNLWYARAAFNRLWADQLQQMIDPNYAASYGRLEQRARQQGTQYYWHPGQVRPERAPDLSNLGAQPPATGAPL